MGIVDPLDPLYQWPRKQQQQQEADSPHVSRLTLLHAVLLFLCFLLLFRIVLLRVWYAIVAFVRRLFASSPAPVSQQTSFTASHQPSYKTPAYAHGSSYY